MLDAKLKFNRASACPNCFREKQMCICAYVESFSNKIKVLILQHPQEQFKMLNSARLASLILKNSGLRVGLSWPNLKKIAGNDEMPSNWGILYLKNELHLSNPDSGEGKEDGRGCAGKGKGRYKPRPNGQNQPNQNSPMIMTDRRGEIIEQTSHIKGIIAIDGSWKQAKAMWWRNPWFLRLNRVSLNPEHPSLRKQIKKSGLSTIEAAALALERLGEDACSCQSMIRQYKELIVKPAGELARGSPKKASA
ncbi:MAG: DTW domain-containing protein [Chitinispirillales bacterium]|jgi:DTW domain-containing protein YfiP|nr:DTW domain-containing protein [Chitinispirillales bacterium]